jgi:hypothetical protein
MTGIRQMSVSLLAQPAADKAPLYAPIIHFQPAII